MYLQLTFVTLAMLVVGGMGSLSGAVVGTAVVSFITEFLGRFEQGGIGGLHLTLRPGIREVVIAVLTMVILLWRPSGLTGSRELSWPRRRQPKPDLETESEVPSAVG
jgi:branched-chain amino acid transport system permease protein